MVLLGIHLLSVPVLPGSSLLVSVGSFILSSSSSCSAHPATLGRHASPARSAQSKTTSSSSQPTSPALSTWHASSVHLTWLASPACLPACLPASKTYYIFSSGLACFTYSFGPLRLTWELYSLAHAGTPASASCSDLYCSFALRLVLLLALHQLFSLPSGKGFLLFPS